MIVKYYSARPPTWPLRLVQLLRLRPEVDEDRVVLYLDRGHDFLRAGLAAVDRLDVWVRFRRDFQHLGEHQPLGLVGIGAQQELLDLGDRDEEKCPNVCASCNEARIMDATHRHPAIPTRGFSQPKRRRRETQINLSAARREIW
jgi:hypothetical protein